MLSFSTRAARRLVPACVLSALAIAALGAPGVASAARFAKCTEGTEINGEGSTLQELAMKETWGGTGAKRYNSATNANPKACKGGPAVTYNTKGKTGSGKGMENWYELEEFGPVAQAFVGTDNAPSPAIITKIEAKAPGSKVLTIPTLQAAVALVVHLPEHCTATADPKTLPNPTLGRLVLAEKTVEKIFTRKDTKWSQIKDGGDKLSGAGCVPTTEITRAVREDGSGTTALFKKWLELVNGKGENANNDGKVCNAAKETWLQCAEEPPANITWPQETTKLVRGNGNGGVLKKVEETPGSIGYVVLANARKSAKMVPPEGGEGKEEFWAELENGQKETVEGKKDKVFSEPADNGDLAAKSKANCAGTEYVTINPVTGQPIAGKFPPASTEEAWNTVSAAKKQIKYALCGFTYDLGLTKFSGAKGAEESEITTAGDFLEWVLNTEAEGGQKEIEEEKDYEALPENVKPEKNVLLIARKGAEKDQF